MDHDFGKRLEKARIERGLSIEQAAAGVRVRGTFLRALESGDLTKFPNAAYAKSFLLMYGRFLGVDVRASAAEIDTTTQMKVEGYQYLTSRAAELPKAKAEPEPSFSMAPTPRSSGSWLPLLVLGGLAVMLIAAFIFWSNLNRLGDPAPEPQKSGTIPKSDEIAVQPLAHVPATTTVPVGLFRKDVPTREPDPLAEGLPAGPGAISTQRAPTPVAGQPPAPLAGEPEIPRARPISPVARIASSDADVLAEFGDPKSRNPAPIGAAPAGTVLTTQPDEETTLQAEDPGAIILEPRRKTWVVIRSGPGGQPLYEDYLYPTAKPLRLPAGRYFIELKEADAVEISRNGRRIAYSAPGVVIQ